MKASNKQRLERAEKDIEAAEVVRALTKLAPHNATAAKILLEMRYGRPEESHIDFRLTIIDQIGGKDGETVRTIGACRG
jgi:hypothetical protein